MLIFFNFRLKATIDNQLREFVSVFSEPFNKHGEFKCFKWIHHGLNGYLERVY